MERQEFEIWIRRLRPRLVDEAVRLIGDGDEAEDAVQETVLKLWSVRGQLSEYHSADGMAIVIVRRLSLNRLRRPAYGELPELPSDRTPESEFITAEEAARLERLLRQLPDAQQAVLRMKHMDGLEVAEIASMTGCSAEAVRQNLSRARRRILNMFRI
ncbi:MAG: sigma-70 family RNA polymerase sigma factor [Prevotella sp.]|nr:sigma-70 family RNA polymerase sigma factor [Prevotella sp.]